MPYKDLTPPAGAKISVRNGKLTVPDNPILPFIRGASVRAAALTSLLRSRGRAVGTLDLLIAAIALTHGVTRVLTRDERDFSRIPGIRVETY